MTNGEKLKEVFPSIKLYEKSHDAIQINFDSVWWNAEYKDPTTKNDLALIHTEGLDEEIRCTMCTNHMKSDRGCDGSCVVNKDMYKAVMDAIEKRIQPTTKNDLAVDCIVDVLGSYTDLDIPYKREIAENILTKLPSVTPQEPRKGHWIVQPSNKEQGERDFIWWKCSECGQVIFSETEKDRKEFHAFCGRCGAKMESEVEE